MEGLKGWDVRIKGALTDGWGKGFRVLMPWADRQTNSLLRALKGRVRAPWHEWGWFPSVACSQALTAMLGTEKGVGNVWPPILPVLIELMSLGETLALGSLLARDSQCPDLLGVGAHCRTVA